MNALPLLLLLLPRLRAGLMVPKALKFATLQKKMAPIPPHT